MCITSLEAELKSTIIGAWDIEHPKYGYRHVLAYQNAPQNLAKKSNCMLLHIPSAEPILPEHILDTSDCPDFLKKMEQSVKNQDRSRGYRTGTGRNYIVQMGIYHIAILNNLDNIEEVLSQIPDNKKSTLEKEKPTFFKRLFSKKPPAPSKEKPKIGQKFLEFYKEHFPNYPLLLCFFNNKDIAKASPIMVHYAPIEPKYIMFPTLDGHGKLPNIGERIEYIRTFVYGSYQLKKSNIDKNTFDLENVSPHLLPFIPKYGGTENVQGMLPNTDLLIEVEDIANGGDVRPYFDLLPTFKKEKHLKKRR